MVALVAAAPAGAANISERKGAVLPGTVVAYTAAGGEANVVTITPNPDVWVVKESRAPLSATSPCAVADGYTTFDPYCPASGVFGAEVVLGDGADEADLSRLTSAAVVAAGTGQDKVTTGSGSDIIDVRDGEADTVTCGGGTDSVSADPIDKLAADCERPQTGTGAGIIAPAVAISANAQKVRAVRRRGLAFKLLSGRSAVKVRVSAKLPRSVAKKLKLGRRSIPAGTITVELAPNQSRSLRLKLSRRVRNALRKAPRRSQILLTATPSGAGGKQGTPAELAVTLKR